MQTVTPPPLPPHTVLQVSPPIISFMETITEAPKPVQPPPGALAAAIAAAAAAAAAAGGGGGAASAAAGAAAAAAAPSGGDDTDPASASAHAAAPQQQQPQASPQQPQQPQWDFERPWYGGAVLPWSWAASDSAPGVAYHPPSAAVVAVSPDRTCALRVRALPLPPDVTALLQGGSAALQALASVEKAAALSGGGGGGVGVGAGVPASALAFLARLRAAFAAAGPQWAAASGRLWAVGPQKTGCNVLIGPPPLPSDAAPASGAAASTTAEEGSSARLTLPISASDVPPLWHTVRGAEDGAAAADRGPGSAAAPLAVALRAAIAQGFQLTAAAGPLCGEPLWGVAFFVDSCVLSSLPPPAGRATAGGGRVAAAAAAASAAGGGESGPLLLVEAPPADAAAPGQASAIRTPGNDAASGCGRSVASGDDDAASSLGGSRTAGSSSHWHRNAGLLVSPAGGDSGCGGSESAGATVRVATASAGGAGSTLSHSAPAAAAAAFAVSSGQVIVLARDACRAAFQAGAVRLVEAMLRCVERWEGRGVWPAPRLCCGAARRAPMGGERGLGPPLVYAAVRQVIQRKRRVPVGI